MSKTNKLNICLIKPAYSRPQDIIAPGATPHAIGEIGILYVEPSHPTPPAWVTGFFGNDFRSSVPLISSSAKGVFLTHIRVDRKDYNFAVIFGYGRHLLKPDVIEDRFGLKVVLNSVDHKNLRSLDKTSLGSVPKQTREQMSRESEVADFGIDIEQDLISSVTGKSRIADLGTTISGRDALAACQSGH